MNLIKYVNLEISYLCNLSCDYCFLKTNVRHNTSKFDRWDDLLAFLSNSPLEDHVIFNLASGELSIRPKLLLDAYNNIKKIERIRDIKTSFGLFSNATNIEFILSLLNKGILDKNFTFISWDGVSNYHRCKDKVYKNFFNNQIKKIGNSKFNNLLIRSALTKDLIENIDDTFNFLIDSGCTNWEYYYLIDNPEYATEEFAELFKEFLYKIFTNKKLVPYNLKAMVDDFKDDCNNGRKTWCKTGNTIETDINGNILPCGSFSNACKYKKPKIKFDDILEDFDFGKLKGIMENECTEECDYLTCGNKQCRDCIRCSKYRTGELKITQQCELRNIEKDVLKIYGKI